MKLNRNFIRFHAKQTFADINQILFDFCEKLFECHLNIILSLYNFIVHARSRYKYIIYIFTY